VIITGEAAAGMTGERDDAKGDLFCRPEERLDHTGEIENFEQSSLDET